MALSQQTTAIEELVMETLGKVFFGLGIGLWFLVGIVGLVITFGIVRDALGIVVAIIGLFLFPALLGLAPWYAGIADGDWQPLILIYGGGVVATVLFWLGAAITHRWPE